ncbi:MAG: hypothetical protein RRY95_01450 [Oscillospiraceae bacterium]
MLGWIDWAETPEKRHRGVVMAERTLLGVRFLGVTLPGETGHPLSQKRRAAMAARRLEKAGVTRAVFPKAFPHGEIFARHGVLPVSELPLRRELAAALTGFVMAQKGLSPGCATIGVVAERLSGDVLRTVTELCLHNRYVLLSVPYGGTEFCRGLRRSYGVSVLENPDAGQLNRTDILLLFAPRPDLSPEKGTVLALYEGAENAFLWEPQLPSDWAESVPATCEMGQLLAALTAAGALRPCQIAVQSFSPRA